MEVWLQFNLVQFTANLFTCKLSAKADYKVSTTKGKQTTQTQKKNTKKSNYIIKKVAVPLTQLKVMFEM
jgi:hypothetical protein